MFLMESVYPATNSAKFIKFISFPSLNMTDWFTKERGKEAAKSGLPPLDNSHAYLAGFHEEKSRDERFGFLGEEAGRSAAQNGLLPSTCLLDKNYHSTMAAYHSERALIDAIKADEEKKKKNPFGV